MSVNAYRNDNRLLAGFSLVELSVVLIIIGILISGVLTILTNKYEYRKIKVTEERIQEIEKAIDRFVLANNRLPCPANGSSVLMEESELGFEKYLSLDPVLCEGNFSFDNIYSGVVPVFTLGLSGEYLMDGWNRRFSYVVDGNFVNSEITDSSCNKETNTSCFKLSSQGRIKIKDASANFITEEVVFVIISHGKNGFGAYKRFGSDQRLEASDDEDERDNAGDDKGSFDNEFIQKSVNNSFDDIISYKSKSQIVNSSEMIQDIEICNAAREVYDEVFLNSSIENTICKKSKDENLCNEMSKRIYSICAY